MARLRPGAAAPAAPSDGYGYGRRRRAQPQTLVGRRALVSGGEGRAEGLGIERGDGGAAYGGSATSRAVFYFIFQREA